MRTIVVCLKQRVELLKNYDVIGVICATTKECFNKEKQFVGHKPVL